MTSQPLNLSRADFQTDQNVRWCPGCGDYAILAQVQKLFPQLGIPRENFVVISGIGCSGRFPYYMNTYGMHSIHGRAPAFVTGIKCARPDLSVWMITGDGDALSIGGNHMLHILRRNVDAKILLFNNRIYGLTKGQYSPTSEQGKMTKSTPMGSIDSPVNPLAFALGANASFIARTVDREPKHMLETLRRAAEHKGSALVEIFQNCNIFNDGAFAEVTDRKTKGQHQLVLEHGKPLVFAKGQLGIRFNGFTPEVVKVDEVGLDQIHVHDERGPAGYIQILTQMGGDLPVPIGVLRQELRPTYDGMLNAQVEQAQESRGRGDLASLLHGKDTWKVE
jgi:2-oxoglutarate ferredoxin oxidoreductase subunit beta